jgi:CO/xanthine dehydrogenase FAD-binding subunit
VSESELHLPKTLDEALHLRNTHRAGLTVMGGGTIVMLGAAEGHLIGKRLMSLQRLGLDRVESVNGGFRIGAATTVKTIQGVEGLTQGRPGVPPLLAESAATLGGPAIRNMATVGGNLFARPPWGDLTVALLALDATVELTSIAGKRGLSLAEFLQTGCRDEELLTAVDVSKPTGRTAYLKLRRRRANSPAVVAVAVRVEVGTDRRCRAARVALIGAADKVVRSFAAESELEGSALTNDDVEGAARAAVEAASPFSDALASEWYRRKMVGVFVRRALDNALSSGRDTPSNGTGRE